MSPNMSWNRQRHSQMPFHRYRSVHSKVEVPIEQRDWPTRRLTKAPLWVPVDLRDGNQALAEPMDPERKRRFFELMVAMGYKEIEVGYPSASEADFDFVRLIAGSDIAPDDVTIVVFTPARRELIERTVASIQGVSNPVVIHLYAATAPIWRETVLGYGKDELKQMILAGARDILELAGGEPDVRFEFSPEVFNLTEPDYMLEICDAVTEVWDASPDRPVILNLPATIEVSTPNVYADQIEFMDKHLSRRESVILSIHPHNDRGTGVACAELALLAGAERVEGCIFGNGERTGNVDIATLALNLLAEGIDPMIDFSEIDEIRRTVEFCNRIEIHPRHPYVGDFVHTAFSGTHQDAIRKGFGEHRSRAADRNLPEREIEWRVPYLPIDPADIGRSYDEVIRVNSQSGKGGVSYLLETEYGIELPRRLQIEFARHAQRFADATGGEITAKDLWGMFETNYLAPTQDGNSVSLTHYETKGFGDQAETTVGFRLCGTEFENTYVGIGPVEALTRALEARGVTVDVLGLHQTSFGTGSDSEALTLLEFRDGETASSVAGKDPSVLVASLDAVTRAAERALALAAT
jgi:2-isopropylmalate synthase